MRTSSRAAALTVIVFVTAALAAQEEPRPKFEVASVKQNTSGDAGLRVDIQPGGRFVATNMPLKQLIRAAYTLQLYQIVDAPSWIDSERFDVIATAGRDITVTTPWIPGSRFVLAQLMLQSLLADRFRMVAHNETRTAQVYSLVVANALEAGRKLAAAAPDCGANCGMRISPGTLHARNVPLPQLAEFLSQVTGRLVTDHTELRGRFDLDLQWRPDQQPDAGDAPSVFTALQEQLGLKLEPGRGPIDVLVIDQIEHPTPD